ncbi:hypothetical protein HN954_00210 [bacterium]|jgi:hypothetical protein|nr:hypothetical protein [bacterium]MBT6832059.1 hypothetical protein [bacterium]MBT6995840.1 hypothetical protein [bacterium]MBT7772349.1 hypothetical protein [bacterium]
MSEQLQRNIDQEQQRIDTLDKSEDQKFDVADATSSVFQGVDNFQKKLAQMNVPAEKQAEYLQKISQNLENITGKEELKAVIGVLDAQLKNFEASFGQNEEFKKFVGPYLEKRSQGVRGGCNLNDIEDVVSEQSLNSYAYAPFLLHMLKDFDDFEWDNSVDREEVLAKKAVPLVAANLRTVKEQMSKCSDISSPEYQQLLAVYKEDAKIMAEVIGNVGGDYEAPEFRDPTLAAEFAGEALSAMTVDEGIAWTKQTMERIDDNDWQSKGLKAAYGNLATTCRNILQSKLREERGTIAKGDAAAVKENTLKVIDMAKLFTDRGEDIDSDLCAPDWAAEMLRDVLGFEDFMVNYLEKQITEPESEINQKLKKKQEDVRDAVSDNADELPAGMTVEGVNDFLNKLDQRGVSSVQDYSTQYTQLRMLEAQIEGEQINQQQIVAETGTLMTEVSEKYLDTGDWGADISSLSEYTGINYSQEQQDAYDLLKDIQGMGLWDWSDKTHANIVTGTKIAGMIVVGIAVGIATGGTGFAAMAASYGATVGLSVAASTVIATGLVGGVAMTATNALMNKRGFDDWGEAAQVYGTEFAVNSLGFGVGKGLSMLRMAKYGDDALAIGKRLTALGVETSVDMTSGFAIDIAGMTIQEGISFTESFEMFKSNPMSWGLGLAMAGFGIGTQARSMMKGMKNIDLSKVSDNDLHGINQSMNKMKNYSSLLEADLDGTGMTLQYVFKSRDLDDIIPFLPAHKQASFRKNFENYVEGQKGLLEISKLQGEGNSKLDLNEVEKQAYYSRVQNLIDNNLQLLENNSLKNELYIPFDEFKGYARNAHWDYENKIEIVDTKKVVGSVAPIKDWSVEYDSRQGRHVSVANDILTGSNKSLDHVFHLERTKDAIKLIKIEGPSGPVYFNRDGTHRTGGVKLSKLSEFPALVTETVTMPSKVVTTDLILKTEWERNIDKGFIKGRINESMNGNKKEFSLEIEDQVLPWMHLNKAEVLKMNEAYAKVYPEKFNEYMNEFEISNNYKTGLDESGDGSIGQQPKKDLPKKPEFNIDNQIPKVTKTPREKIYDFLAKDPKFENLRQESRNMASRKIENMSAQEIQSFIKKAENYIAHKPKLKPTYDAQGNRTVEIEKSLNDIFKLLERQKVSCENYLQTKRYLFNNLKEGDVIYSKNGSRYKVLEMKEGVVLLKGKDKNVNMSLNQKNLDNIATIKTKIELSNMSSKTGENVVTSLWGNGIKSEVLQGNTGDCYLLSTIQTLKQNEDLFKHIVSEMITPVQNGWKVKFKGHVARNKEGKGVILPGKEVMVTRAELYEWKKSNSSLASSADGDLILEKAYADYHHSIKYGEGAGKAPVNDSNMAFSFKNSLMVCQDFFGPRAFTAELAKTTEDITRVLLNFKKGELITASSARGNKGEGGRLDSQFYFVKDVKGKEVKMFKQHAYAVENVDQISKTLTISNPHNTRGEKYTLSFEVFAEACQRVTYAKLN